MMAPFSGWLHEAKELKELTNTLNITRNEYTASAAMLLYCIYVQTK